MKATQAAGSLEIRDLSAGYRHRPVLHDVTLPILPAGQHLALVGPNGAGKSTLLRVLAGLVEGRGHVTFEGLDLLRVSPMIRAQCVAFMPQTLPHDVTLTVLDGLLGALKASPLASPVNTMEEAQRRAIEVLERIGIAHLALQPLHHLSGGERQLAALAQAIVREPSMLLLDEPTSALDLRHQVTVMSIARALAREGRLVISVLHDLTLAARWADQLVVLHEGRIQAIGAPADALTSQLLSRIYDVDARVEPCSFGYPQVIVDGTRG
ncbi:ABC transporter ATP-binding protein [Gemmatimonas aurantiaca]|uniref:ABC transporter ATP-binding protein n=1 Tax=Gemmatimonas aurantiaca TaxID=173480 RepID=UPI00301C8230